MIGPTIAGWLGGELVFKHGVAVTAQAPAAPQKPDPKATFAQHR